MKILRLLAVLSALSIGTGLFAAPLSEKVADSFIIRYPSARQIHWGSDRNSFTWQTGYASRTGEVKPFKGAPISISRPFSFNTEISEEIYRVETPDGITPLSGGSTFLRYGDTNVSAGVCFQGKDWKSVSLGFPIETVTSDKDRQELLGKIMAWFKE